MFSNIYESLPNLQEDSDDEDEDDMFRVNDPLFKVNNPKFAERMNHLLHTKYNNNTYQEIELLTFWIAVPRKTWNSLLSKVTCGQKVPCPNILGPYVVTYLSVKSERLNLFPLIRIMLPLSFDS